MQRFPIEVPAPLPNTVLPDADWADAFEIQTDRHFPDLKAVASCMVGTMPSWSKPLLWLRNVLVAPFGLKPADPRGNQAAAELVGFFPLVAQDGTQIVLGFNDFHLDFRILIEQQPRTSGVGYRLTTLVDRHNLFGRIYLCVITPFHKLIVRSAMKNAL